MTDLILKDESYEIMGACFEVYNELGCGFLESVYHECLEIEFKDRGIPHVSKPQVKIRFKDRLIDKRFEADFICYGQVIVELKTTSEISNEHIAQTLNYLHATRLPLGILINFGHYPKLQYQRIALTERSR